jgi:hypothetical protein
MDRALWKSEFSRTGPLPWRCPYCHQSRPKVLPKSVAEGETRDSLRAKDEDAWEPDWIEGRFSLMAVCDDCKGSVAVTGRYRITDDRFISPTGEMIDEWGTHYRPLWFSDAPHIIAIPDKTPDPVAAEIRDSFQLFWGDLSSCANRIRAAVEHLLTHQRIPKSRKTKKGARTFLPLHQRIELFQLTKPALADKLMAIKWVGNAGSHSTPVKADDILDGYEMLSFVLEELFVRRSAHVSKLAKAINKRRAPRSRRRNP